MIPVTGSKPPIWPMPFREPRDPVLSHCHVQRIGVARAGRRRELGVGTLYCLSIPTGAARATPLANSNATPIAVGRRRGYRQKEAGGVAFGTGDYRDNSMR
jgi:hypothetical protein